MTRLRRQNPELLSSSRCSPEGWLRRSGTRSHAENPVADSSHSVSGGCESLHGQDVFLRSEGEVRVRRGWRLQVIFIPARRGMSLAPILHMGELPTPKPLSRRLTGCLVLTHAQPGRECP